MGAFNLQSGVCSDVGKVRENNEDRVYADPTLGLFLVADGMGGQLAGEQASQMAVDILPDLIEKGLKTEPANDKAVARLIRESVVEANRQIMDLAAKRLDFQSMGTTLVLALVHDKLLFVAGIGDSRAYHARSNKIDQLTTDHSLAQALVEAKTISPKEAKEHRFRNILWKYLGSKEVGLGPDVSISEIAAGDRVLLASDGLTGVVADSDLLDCLKKEINPQQAAESLVALALKNDSRDNVSCITVYLN